MKHDLPVCFPAVSNVQILPCIIPSVKLVNAFQSALRTQFQRTGFQHLKKILFLKAVLVCAPGKDDHYKLCIAYASAKRASQDWCGLQPPAFQEPHPARKLALADVMNQIVARHGRSTGEVAIASSGGDGGHRSACGKAEQIAARLRTLQHLDIKTKRHHDVSMRTTLTIEDDLADRLAQIAWETQQPFKVVLNETLRRGLAERAPRVAAFDYQSHPGNLLPGIDERRLNELAWQLDEERFHK